MSGFDFGLDRLVIGLFTGLTYGLLAVGLVLVFRSSRFVNFAHGSVGAFGASMLALFVADWGVPYWVAFVIAILIAGLLSGAIEVVVVRRLEGRPSLVGMIATLGLSQLILVMSLLINSDGVSGFTFPRADPPADLRDPVAADRHAVRRDAGARPDPARRARLVPAPPPHGHGDPGRGRRPRQRSPRGHPGSLDGHARLGDRRWHRGLLRDPGDARRRPAPGWRASAPTCCSRASPVP